MTTQDALILTIEPVSIKNIEQAQKLLELVFPYCKTRKYPPEQSVYLSMIGDVNYLKEENISSEEFFVATNNGEEILGTTGLTVYQRQSPFTCWLGWFCVNPDFRKKGLGGQILSWTLQRAKEKGFKNLKVETSDHENEAGAQLLYESFGINVFRFFPAKNIGSGENFIIHRKVSL